ncbi:MAG: hypothetical protein EOO43_04275 [Flavobacterium sp.]|nr:MAG: hypothetical protein EOO43_04275 [Flavobacterium sp.]
MYIHVPKVDSADVDQALPVLYLLDGENHFHMLSAYIDYLSHWKVIPPMLIVGIINVDRVKDLTPTPSVTNFSGKIDSNYRTSGGNESPSIWFGNNHVLRLAEQKLPNLPMKNKKLFYSVGDEDDSFRNI